MSFLTTTRLFSQPVRLTQWGGYFFDFLFLLFLWASYDSVRNLHGFSTGAPTVSVPGSAFVFLGALGIYGVRLAMYVAILRHNRAPQTLEWLVTNVPFVLAIPCFVASSRLVKLDAELHHYRFCYRETQRAPRYVFAAPSNTCPPLPPDAVPD